MANSIAAVGIFADDASIPSVDVPQDLNEVVDTLNKIVDKYETGDVISDEDKAIVKSYLQAIGVDETSLSSYDALIGTGKFEFDRSELGLDVHVNGYCGCEDSGEGRIVYMDEMNITKTGGDTEIRAFDFTMRGASFGMGPSGQMKLIYKREFKRDFAGGDSAGMSFFDRYTLTTWGFFFSCTCKLTTSKGDIIIR